jgi:hypothetical protein
MEPMRTILVSIFVLLPLVALAQSSPTQAQLPPPAPAQQPSDAPTQAQLPPPDQNQPPPEQQPGQPPPGPEAPITAYPSEPVQPQAEPPSPTQAVLPPMQTPPAPAPSVPMIDGHPRYGPFLSGPGSLMFLTTHTLLGTAGGLVTQGVANDWNFDLGSREAILAGTLVGAGAGFGVSAWWQFNHWIGKPAAAMTLTDSIVGGMALTGLVNLTTQDQTALAWSGFLGSELGAWLTIGIGGGDLSFEHSLLLASGEGWGEIYASLLLAIVHFSGSSLTSRAGADTLLIAPAVGAIAMAVASARINPTARQILRANVAGAAVGGTVLLLSALVLGHIDKPTPYVLAMISSATTMAIVSIFWDDRAASPTPTGGAAPYRSVWW